MGRHDRSANKKKGVKKIRTKRFATILGITLTAMVLMSNSALATWWYIDHVENYQNCTNINYIIGAPNAPRVASLGIDSPQTLGWALLDFGVDTGMGEYWDFTVYASSSTTETYKLRLISDLAEESTWWTTLDDTKNNILTTGPLKDPDDQWRYVEVWSENGSSGDYAYGSDIDAIGFEPP